MTLNCNNINLKKGSKGEQVKEAQNLLKQLSHYNGKIDGDYGDLTVNAVKQFQKKQGTLAVDGVIGPVTCKKLNTAVTPTSNYSYYKNGIYHSGQHWTGNGCNKKGQCNGYFCACCSVRQQTTKQGIETYTQQNIASLAGTTTAGTGHNGINTAIYTIFQRQGKKVKITWKNFSELGSTTRARFEALGKLISQQNISVILHTLYQYKWGHYETVQEVNMNNNTVTMLNSLGSKCNSPAYCGYTEVRDWNRLARELAGISQPSVCIITVEA